MCMYLYVFIKGTMHATKILWSDLKYTVHMQDYSLGSFSSSIHQDTVD